MSLKAIIVIVLVFYVTSFTMVKGKIVQLEVENFKSYSGSTTIGPFTEFTAVIGPNGSGKSNVMDAISFVLGVRANVLRGSNLQDLIHTSPQGVRADRAVVTLVFSTTDGGRVTEYRLSRTVRTDGSSQYGVNGGAVTHDKYDELLRSLGIYVKTRNFLVFQGVYVMYCHDVQVMWSPYPLRTAGI